MEYAQEFLSFMIPMGIALVAMGMGLWYTAWSVVRIGSKVMGSPWPEIVSLIYLMVASILIFKASLWLIAALV